MTVNEWLRFDRPGKYRIVGHSEIVCLDTEESGSAEGYPIPLTSDPVEIEILPPDDARRLARIEKAREQLESEDDEARYAAARDLRFMVDARAIPLLVPHLSDPFGNVVVEARFGLLSFADLSPVKAEILERMKQGSEIPAEDVFLHAELIALAEVQASGITGGWDSDEWVDAYYERLDRWKRDLGGRLLKEIESLPPADAVKTLVDGMALGSLYPRDDEGIWKFVLANLKSINEGPVRSRVVHLIEGLRMESFLPDLKKIVEDEAIHGRLRSASILAIHEMGEDPYRDLIVSDLTSESPRLTAPVHATLGEYRAEEIGNRLLGLFLATEGRTRIGVAERIRDFGGAIRAEDLLRALESTRKDRSGRFPLLSALALKSPAHTMPFLRRFFESPWERRGTTQYMHLRLLTRIDTPGSQVLLRELLLAPEADDRVETIRQLRQTQQDSPGTVSPHRLPEASLAARFFPELMLLFKGDPSARVRVSAQRLLSAVTGIPEEGSWGESSEAAREWLPLWEKWWDENGARFGRWGRVRHGIAMRVTLGKGGFDGSEPIPAVVTIRREEGDRALMRDIRLRVAYLPYGGTEDEVYPRSDPLELPKSLTLRSEVGSEVGVELNLRDTGLFTKPGVYRVHVRHALLGPSQATNRQERDLVIAHPFTLRIR